MRHASSGDFLVEYKPSPLACGNLFLILWLTGWTAGCIWLINVCLTDRTIGPAGWIMLAFFGSVDVWMCNYIAWNVFGRIRVICGCIGSSARR